MPTPILNGVLKPADVIAHGPHIFNEATRKYEERQSVTTEYPRAMWHHGTRQYAEAQSREQQNKMGAEGWSTKPFPEQVVAKDTITTPPADLALIVLQQQQMMAAQAVQMETMQQELAKLAANQPTTAPAIPETPRRMGRPPVYPLTMTHGTDGERTVASKGERDVLEAKGWTPKEA